ncbi:MAG: outer membrane protein assembly factor BamD [Myxococcota bacterium]
MNRFFVTGGRLLRPLLLLLTLLSLNVSTAWAQRDPQTPEEMYAQAVKLIERGYFERSVELLERIKTRYPFSQYATLAELRVADSYLQRGEYLAAVESYRSFLKLHPRHPELDYVTFKMAEAEFKQAPTMAQRDQAPTRRMLTIVQNFEERYPSSKYIPDVQKMRLEGRTLLGKGLFGIGLHYYRLGRFEQDAKARTGAFNAALQRFEEVLGQYPDVLPVCADALYYMGLIYLREQQKSEAEGTVERMKQRVPKSALVGRLERRVSRHRWVPPKLPAPLPPAAPVVEPSAGDVLPSDVVPADAAPADAAPVEAVPADAAPVEAAPADAVPVTPENPPAGVPRP